MVKKVLNRFPKTRNFLRILWHLNYHTIRFNFTYFSFADAIKFPVFVQKTIIYKMKGKVKITAPLSSGMIRIGDGFVGHFDKNLKSIWEVQGEIVFHGNTLIKHGSKLIVGVDGKLEIGPYFRFSTNSVIICNHKIVIGHTCRISWDVMIMDSDFHKITTLEGEQINAPRPISIGDHVWIGARSSIMKGAKIGNDCVVASNSVVTKEIEGTRQVIAGVPAKVVRTGVNWEG